MKHDLTSSVAEGQRVICASSMRDSLREDLDPGLESFAAGGLLHQRGELVRNLGRHVVDEVRVPLSV
jgi:hypothetical protein